MSSSSGLNRRRFPRVFIPHESEKVSEILGAAVFWADGTQSGVLDLSYSGAALSKPSGKKKMERGELIDLRLSFGTKDSISLKAKVMRSDAKSIAVHFPDMAANDRLVIERFLQSKLLGSYTRLVDPSTYSRNVTFDFWFHGPKDTNIYVWPNHNPTPRFAMDPKGTSARSEVKEWPVDRAVIELDYSVLFLDGVELTKGESLPQLDQPSDDYSYFLNEEIPHFKLGEQAPIVERALEVLSQIQDPTGVISKLSQQIRDVRKLS